ncbi:alpha/beta hydrolase [Sphingomonas ginkgonis]|uniref:Alpha/beta hydrolase n=1 Tax=Sphingomonas ginkgonis TaxID=2315330 RepID=A0A3R9YN20_9SPHN|nr:alpha/beta hydrolase [Sphingomonas ginkgonis]RST31533.1 alpha/beta hydrolase [Sphingomonas ginkgonis]
MMDHASRRDLLRGAAILGAIGSTGPAWGQTLPTDEVLPLWPNVIPGDLHRHPPRKVDDQSHGKGAPDRWVEGISQPMLVVRRPARPTGAGVLVIPGGGYGFLSYDNEGTSQAAWLNARGITAFILLYRLPAEGWSQRQLVPLQDAQRAMRLIRSRSASLQVSPSRLAVLGFSAGGHLAGSLATRFSEPTYAPVDAADRLSARPDLAALVYPVVSMAAPFTHGGSRDNLLGPDAATDLRQAASVETRVTGDTPPSFLVHAGDDGLVPVANSIALYNALLAARRPAELNLFDEGGHGFGTRLPAAMPGADWPQLLHRFAVRKGVFTA